MKQAHNKRQEELIPLLYTRGKGDLTEITQVSISHPLILNLILYFISQ